MARCSTDTDGQAAFSSASASTSFDSVLEMRSTFIPFLAISNAIALPIPSTITCDDEYTQLREGTEVQ